MSERKPKVWGTTEALLSTPLAELHRIEAKRGFHCSWHHHGRKHNLFYVLSGKLVIQEKILDGNLEWTVHETVLRENESYSVAPGVVHRFATTSEDCLALELYYLEPLGEDIIRRDVGGPNIQPAP